MTIQLCNKDINSKMKLGARGLHYIDNCIVHVQDSSVIIVICSK